YALRRRRLRDRLLELEPLAGRPRDGKRVLAERLPCVRDGRVVEPPVERLHLGADALEGGTGGGEPLRRALRPAEQQVYLSEPVEAVADQLRKGNRCRELEALVEDRSGLAGLALQDESGSQCVQRVALPVDVADRALKLYRLRQQLVG